MLRWLAGLSDNPWLCFGDFNEILHPNEKIGGNDRNIYLIREFREALCDCNLVDLGCKGYLFTWNNGRFGKDFVEERLDRFLSNKGWSDKYENCTVVNFETWTSDRCPTLLEVLERGSGIGYMKMSASRIHYEDMWSTYEACKEIIDREWKRHDNWRSDDLVQLFKQTAKTSMAQLKSWSNEEFKGRQQRLEKLMVRLKELNYSGMQHNSGEEIKRVKNRIHNILLDKEIYWKQRSRADWLRKGDKYTKYFHAKASSRKIKNKI